MTTMTMIYTHNFDWLFSFVSDYNEIIYTIFITLSVISIISLPMIFASNRFGKAVWDGTKWVGAGASFGAG